MDYTGLRKEGEDPIDTTGKYRTLIDKRDGHVYKTLDIKLADGTTDSIPSNYYDWDKLDKATQLDYQSQELLVYPLYIEENNSIKIAFAGTSYNFVGPRAPNVLDNCSNRISFNSLVNFICSLEGG